MELKREANENQAFYRSQLADIQVFVCQQITTLTFNDSERALRKLSGFEAYFENNVGYLA